MPNTSSGAPIPTQTVDPQPLSDAQIAAKRAEIKTANQNKPAVVSPVTEMNPNVGPTPIQSVEAPAPIVQSPNAAQFAQMNQGATTVGAEHANAVPNGVSQNPNDKFGGQNQGSNTQLDANGNNIGMNGYGDVNQLARKPGQEVVAKNDFANAPKTMPANGALPLSFGDNVANPTLDSSGNPVTPPTAAEQYHGQFSGQLEDFLNKNLSGYQSMMNDYDKIMQTQIGMMDANNKATLDNLTRRQNIYEAEKQRQIASTDQNAQHLQDVASIQKDNALEANRIAMDQTDAEYGDQVKIAQDKNARYMGYLQGKFAAAGMLDSGAGLELLGKYMTSSDMALAGLQRDKVNAQQTYLGKANQIASDYFEQAYKVEYGRQQADADITFKMNDAITSIEDSKIQSQAKKDENTLLAIKDAANMKVQLKQQAFAEIQQLTQTKLAEAQFSHTVLQDTVKNGQWDKTFDRGIMESDRTFTATQDQNRTQNSGNLWVDGKDTGQRALSGLSYDQQVKQYDEGVRQWNKSFERGTFESDRGFNQGVLESNRTFDRQLSQDDQTRVSNLVAAGVIPKDAMNQFMTAGDVISSYSYQSKNGGSIGLGDKIAQVIKNVTPTNLGSNCVQFVRAVVPDLPTGLYTLQQKMNIINVPKTTLPEPGMALIQSTGQAPGHIAVVTSVNKEKGTFTVAEANWKAGQSGTREISINDKSVQGFWKSPSVSSGANSQEIDGWVSTVSRDPSKITTVPEKLRGQVNSIVESQRAGKPAPLNFQNEGQGKAYSFATRMAEAEDILGPLEKYSVENQHQRALPNALKSPEFQKQEQAERNFIYAQLRKESGAAIADSEYNNALKQYFPQFGDSKEVVAQKRASRETAIKNMQQESGQTFNNTPSSIKIRDNKTGEVRTFPKGTDINSLPNGYSVIQ